MEKRRCVNCGADLTEGDVMKLLFEDGLSEILPLPTCPACFVKQMRERALRQRALRLKEALKHWDATRALHMTASSVQFLQKQLMRHYRPTVKARSQFYEYFRKALNLPKHKITERIEEFTSGLEGLLRLGSKSLEILVMKNLHSKIGVVWEWKGSNPWVLPDLSFAEYVNFAKKYFEDENKYEDHFNMKARAIYR